MLAHKFQSKSGKLPFFGGHFEGLLVLGVEESVLAHVLLVACHFRSLARVVNVQIGGIASALEVVANLFGCLLIVQSQSEATLSSANTLEVVLLDLCLDHMSHICHFLQILLVAVLGQAAQVDVNNITSDRVVLRFLIHLMSIVSIEV